MKVKPNLFLNMSPQTTEEGGLAFARNMKLDDDGNLVSDYGYKNISAMADYNIVGHIVGLDNKIYFFCHTLVENVYVDEIVEYDEVLETATKLDTHWTYDNGEIDGYVSTNQSGEKILTIAEYKSDGHIPLKHINLKFPKIVNSSNTVMSDETIYNQAPKCPTANLVLKDTYVKTIPNGVYVFFIRYKIRKDVYTNWFLCSRPIFGGTSEKITTLQGGLNYINLHKDSAKSFVFQLDFASDSNKTLYKEFQLGFIITHDEATDARIWKHFDTASFKTSNIGDTDNLIYFDYEDIEEANIDDLLETTYELYNVRNVTSFKNKLYISNYIESNFNDLFGLTEVQIADLFTITESHSNETKAPAKNMEYNSVPLSYNYKDGYYDKSALPNDTRTVNDLINQYTGAFNFDVSNLAKIESKEKADVLQFDLYWHCDNNPDLATIYNIYNRLYYKVIFGNDYGEGYGNGRLGMVELYYDGGLWIFGPDNNNKHPWYDLGFTFSYGSSGDNSVIQGVSRNGCWFFNQGSRIYYHPTDPEQQRGWPSHDLGFSDFARSAIEDNIKKEIEGKSFFAKAYLKIASGAKSYNLYYESRMDYDNYAGYNNDLEPLLNEYCNTNHMASYLKYRISSWVYEAIKDKIVGIDENGSPILSIEGEKIRANSISVVFKKFDFSLESEDLESSDSKFVKRFKVALKTTDYTSLCTFAMKDSYLNVVDAGVGAEQKSTLMPLSTYNIYAHFVDNHNIISNGIKVKTITTGKNTTNGDVISLKYSLGAIPNSLQGKTFFFSIVNVGDIVMEGFGYTMDPNNTSTHIINCLEIDTLLYNINDNITIIVYNNNTLYKTITNARYYSSGSSYPALAFGNCGYVSWVDADNNVDYTGKTFYIIVERNKSSENIKDLVKASSYMPLVATNTEDFPDGIDVADGYYGSWLSIIKKPDFALSSSCYVSGNDVYATNRNLALNLTDFKSYIQVQSSITYFIRSNFNLNYLSVTEDIPDKIFTVGAASSGVKQVAKVINSAILSFIYELKPMYRDFANKYFRRYDSDYKIDFDNTIRVSHVLSDETFNNSIFKFSAEDYYNVPTDRGIIVNLFAIGNNIFVHCKGSLYKFDGNTTISANNQDIQLQESEPFDTGISQIFDSEYGYGGIDTKQSGCITFDSYFFYDKSSNHIFAYGGNSQVQMIDGNIYKLLNYYKPTECRVLHDELNCRILFEFTSGRSEHVSSTYKTFTLSYNYKTKTFVSIHDLSLVNAFAGRYRDYSYKGDGNTNSLLRLFEMEQSYTHQEIIDEETVDVTTEIDVTPLVPAMNINKIFGNATTACIIEFGASLYKKQVAPFGIAIVMFPRENLRETINSIKYIADIQQKDPETQSSPVFDVLVNPQVSRTNPVVNFYIVTDCCVSSVVNTNVNDNARPNTLLDYEGFKFDMGAWTSNYFRNDINKIDIYKYGQKYPNRDLDADQNSLIYGRYFIIVFDFKADTPIKFEELFMNSEKY